MIYLDNAATTYPKPELVYQAVMKAMKEFGANPGRGAYKMALEAARVVLDTRSLLVGFFGADKPEEIIFTANATEAINLAIKGLLRPGDHVITTSMEHNAVIRPLKLLEQQQGIKLTIVQANTEGIISANHIREAIAANTKLIIVSHASNVCGSIAPINEIGKIAKEHNVFFAVDAAQSAGYLPIDVKKMHIDLLAFPGHKGLYGPPGVGGLYIREGILLSTLKEGGTGISSHSEYMPEVVPERYESGTLNVPGIAGLGAGLHYVQDFGLKNIFDLGMDMVELLIKGLRSIQDVKIYGPTSGDRVPVVSFNLPNIDAAEAALILDRKYDIAVRAGLHCSPLAHKTLGSIDIGTIRVSLSTFNSREEINYLLSAVQEIIQM